MSGNITVNDFKYIQGKNDAEYISLLKDSLECQKRITSKAIAKIKELSKEQPQIIKCENCEFWRIDYYEDIETCSEHRNIDGSPQATYPDDFCSWARKKCET